MAKTSGLGDALYIGGYDLSGDIQSLSKIAGPIAWLDVTGIDKSAFERVTGHRDGAISMTTYWNPTRSHPVLSALPTTDVLFVYCRGTAIGSPAACMNSLQINYNGTRANTGAYTFAVDAQADAYGLEWGLLQTPGVRTDTAATNGTGWDWANGFVTPAVPGSTTPATNTSPLPMQVVVSGGTVTNVSVNGVTVGSGDGTYQVPAGQTIAITYSVAPTWTWAAQTVYGAQAYLEIMAFTGTDATVTLQDSADGSTYTNLASGSFTQITSSTPGTQRLALSNAATVRRYTRAVTTTVGGFTNLQFAVVMNRNQVAGVAF